MDKKLKNVRNNLDYFDDIILKTLIAILTSFITPLYLAA